MTPERESLEKRLQELTVSKKTAKANGDDRAFVVHAREIIQVLRTISQLPNDNQLTDFQVGAYCWALYALAAKSPDAQDARQNLIRLVRAYRRKIDSPQFWGDGRSAEFGRTLFSAIVVQLYKQVKEANEGAETTLLKGVAKDFLEMLSLRCEAYLDEVAFKKVAVTEEQLQKMEQSAGKRIRMKVWPSLAEKAFGLMNRCLKVDETLKPAAELVSFLGRNVSRGDWLGFYCANARVRIGDYVGARQLLAELVRSKREEAWAWEHLAQAYRDVPEKAVGCLCKALVCPVRDQEIGRKMSAGMHRQLSRLFAALGRNEEARFEADLADGRLQLGARNDFYRQEAQTIADEILGAASADHGGPRKGGGKDAKLFEGQLIKREGNAFGFVMDKALGRVFIPPRFAEGRTNGDSVRGKAILKEDKKKKRMGYSMIFAL